MTEQQHTYDYMFYKFKRGIMVSFNQHETIFTPFSNKLYLNEWAGMIDIKQAKDTIKTLCDIQGVAFNPRKIHQNKYAWVANNALIRYEYPLKEKETSVSILRDMFYHVPPPSKDVTIFLNKRDHPLLRRDRVEPYNYIYGDNKPLLSHNYQSYSKILSMCTTNDFEDVAIPTWFDWACVSREDGVYFKDIDYSVFDQFDDIGKINWEDKVPQAIFRGSSTGMECTKDNIRIKLCQNPNPNLDAGLTYWNMRPRINKQTHKLDTFSRELYNSIKLKPKMTYFEQSKYKYIVHVDGHTASFRKGLTLSTNSVLLVADSPYKLWLDDMLIPWMHYVPVASDLSDLDSKLEWCLRNDSKCKLIAYNAKMLMSKIFTKNYMINHISTILEQEQQTIHLEP
jgi:hypothetical protein